MGIHTAGWWCRTCAPRGQGNLIQHVARHPQRNPGHDLWVVERINGDDPPESAVSLGEGYWTYPEKEPKAETPESPLPPAGRASGLPRGGARP